jgi:hypothetical protein
MSSQAELPGFHAISTKASVGRPEEAQSHHYRQKTARKSTGSTCHHRWKKNK